MRLHLPNWLKRALPNEKRTFDCIWCVGHGDLMVMDPEVVPHAELRKFVKFKNTRVTVEILGEAPFKVPANWVKGISQPLPPEEAK